MSGQNTQPMGTLVNPMVYTRWWQPQIFFEMFHPETLGIHDVNLTTWAYFSNWVHITNWYLLVECFVGTSHGKGTEN